MAKNPNSRVRQSFTLPPALVENLRFVSRKTGQSMSSTVSTLLGAPLEDLCVVLRDVPDNPSIEDIVHAHSEVNKVFTDRLQSYTKATIQGDSSL